MGGKKGRITFFFFGCPVVFGDGSQSNWPLATGPRPLNVHGVIAVFGVPKDSHGVKLCKASCVDAGK